MAQNRTAAAKNLLTKPDPCAILNTMAEKGTPLQHLPNREGVRERSRCENAHVQCRVRPSRSRPAEHCSKQGRVRRVRAFERRRVSVPQSEWNREHLPVSGIQRRVFILPRIDHLKEDVLC